jgi:peptide/nickel transport system substrate-binding protein
VIRTDFSRRRFIQLGAGGALSALLSACGGSGRSMLDDAPKAPSGKRSGNVRVGYVSPTGDPVGMLDAVYSRLVVIDPRKGRVFGDLAQAFELVDDGLTARVRLRNDLRFHPDRENLAAAITAETVRRDYAGRAQSGDYLFAAALERIEATDGRTLVMKLRAPFSLLFDYLSDATTGGVRAEAQYGGIQEPLGSGPFVPVAREDLGTSLVANPLFYRKGLPLLERVQVIDGAPPHDLIAAVSAGELEVAMPAADSADQATRSLRGVTVMKRTSRRLRGLGFSLAPQKGAGTQRRAVPAMQDARVRRAVSLALDRKAIAEAERGAVSGPVGPAHPLDALSEEELLKHPLYQYNPAEARSLLDAAGHRELTFALEGANRPQTRAVMQLVDKQLRDVGLVPRVRLLPVQDWEQLFLAGDFEGALVEFEELRTPDLGLRLHMSGGLSGSFSLWGFSSPKFDSAARAAFAEVDLERRGERSRAAQRVLLDEVPAMFPLSAPPDYVSVAESLTGFAWDAFEFNLGWLSAEWRFDART